MNTSRDRMVVTWLSDTSSRIGGLTGLHLVDLHLRDNADCGECKSPHLHVCHRWGNANRSAAKTKPDWWRGDELPLSDKGLRNSARYQRGGDPVVGDHADEPASGTATGRRPALMGSRVVTPEHVVDSIAAFPALLRAAAG